VKVFDVDAESARFDSVTDCEARGAAGATLRADYDYGVGRNGNVNKGAVTAVQRCRPDQGD